jgi:inner membrane protein
MLFRTHIVFSILIFFLLNWILEIPNKILFLVCILLATAFVDIDMKKSRAGNRWYLRPFQFFTKHRGIIHSIFFGLLISLLIAWINQWAGFGFFVGYISHLFLDALTKSGVAIFWPVWKKKFSLCIKSGGIIEEIIFVLILLADFWIVLKFWFGVF